MATTSLLGLFLLSAIITWIAGIWLTRATDAIDHHFKLGSAFGGLLILGIVTSLPEGAVTITAALQHHYDIIIGTLLGGIAIQTVVLSIFDAVMELRRPLTFAAASLVLVLEASIVILVTIAAILAIHTPIVIPNTGISLASILILLIWITGLWIVYQARNGLPWKAEAIEATPGRTHHERRQSINHPILKNISVSTALMILVLASLATIVGGYGLATIGNTLAGIYGIGSGLFAATVIALVGALPNISTGISSIKLGDYKLAMSDIFGGNAFMPALFLLADLVAGGSILQHASSSDIWFAALGVLVTGVYLIGLIIRPRRQFFRMGADSIVVIMLYILGIAALMIVGG